ncbi:hypothetical protein L6452_36196 [Arctium lappa]|uniref:Uncharacterized protein n=1 Tax=Arctium lappa TaxID=4217 RepID=A0ACB8Y8K5_ARCLA|nr:hypothetical protein L6452_36196 [Arctium lappa]
MFGEVEDQPKKTKKEYISQSGLKIFPSAQIQVCPSDQHHHPGWCQSHISQEYEGVLTSSRSSRRSLKSSVSDDLSLEYEGVLTSSGAEDLSSLRQSMLKDFFQTHCTFLTKYIVISCIDVDLIWRSDKLSFVYYTILRKGLYHPSAGVPCIKCMRHYKYDGCINMQDQPSLKHSSSLSALAFSL